MTNYEKIKLGTKIGKVVSFLLIAFAIFVYANAYSDSIANQSPAITVSGTGKVVAKPDVARFTYSVITEGGKDIASLTNQNNEKTNKIINFLKKQGIPKEDIKTTNYSMNPRYQNQTYGCRNYISNVPASAGITVGTVGSATVSDSAAVFCPPPEIVGYTFNNTVEVTIRGFDKKNLSSLLSGVVSNGANKVSQLRFELDDINGARLMAKAQAIAKAKTEAKRLASESGISLGRILSIDEYGSPTIYATKGVAMGMGSNDIESSAPAIEAGSQDITVTVGIRYALK